MTIGRVKMNSSFDTSKRIPNAIMIKTENMWILFTFVFSNFEIGFSNGNRNNNRRRNKIKVKPILNLFSASS